MATSSARLSAHSLPPARCMRPIHRLVSRTAVFLLGALLIQVLIQVPPASAQAPSNDDISGAVMIGALPFTTTVDTTEATVAATDSPDCAAAATVWFAYTPSTEQSLQADTLGSDYDTVLGVYTGTPGDLTLVGCSDDTPSGTASAVQFDATPGTTYYFSVGQCCGAEPGTVGPGGTAVFNLGLSEPFDAVVTVDSARIVGPGSVEITGTVTCSTEAYFSLSGQLKQRQGLDLATADFYADGPCSTTATTWTAVASSSRVLLPRRATVTYDWYACGAITCASGHGDSTIRVTRAR